MPSAMTDWGSSQFLSICMGIISPPTSMWAALAIDDPGTDTDGTDLEEIEPDPTLGYSRIEIPLDNLNWDDPDGSGLTANLNNIAFPLSTDEWGVVNHFALCDAETAGDVYLYGEFDIPIDVQAGYQYVILPGGIVISFGAFVPSIVAV